MSRLGPCIPDPRPTRRLILGQILAAGALPVLSRQGFGRASASEATIDATFIFTSDVHACRMASGLSPHCQEEGKTDQNLLRHIAAINRIGEHDWPTEIGGVATGLASGGERIRTPLGVVIGGDLTDDGGGQITMPREGTQLLQFSHRYQEGVGPDRLHFPVYLGLGNHDLDQDGPLPHTDWYRRELRDYVEINHRPSVFFKPPVPATDFDVHSDDYSWDWGDLHLIQTHRFAGDTTKGAVSGLGWLRRDLATYAGDERPVIIFQHYGWDVFSVEKWDSETHRFDVIGNGEPHWWSEDDRAAMLGAIAGYNVIGIFHGHEHETAMIYRTNGLDLFKPRAAFLGGFAVVRVTSSAMDVAFAEAVGSNGDISFTKAFSKPI